VAWAQIDEPALTSGESLMGGITSSVRGLAFLNAV
jgi:hypothetical protein